MNYEANTSLNLNIQKKKHLTYIDLESDHSSQNPTQFSQVLVPRVFSCNYCRREFYSSQALGGHQNAHKLERTLAKKSRELSSVMRRHSGDFEEGTGSSYDQVHGPILGIDQPAGHVGRLWTSEEMNNCEQNWKYNGSVRVDEEDFGQLDLSLRL